MHPGGRPSLRVLVVEDDLDTREFLKALLHGAGHEVHAAPDGLAGLSIIESVPIDVALLDIGLPLMCGWELGARIRALKGDRVRLIAVSGQAEREDAMKRGFDEHMLKPLDPARLLHLIT